MAIHVVPGSASLRADVRPAVQRPAPSATEMDFTCRGIHFEGRCQITGNPGDNPAGWTLGLIQVKWIDTDWAFYRGQANSDGSSFLQAARPPALNAKACRDTITPGAFLIDNNPALDRTVAAAGSPLPFPMTAAFGDAPSRHWPLTRINGGTRKVNFLREAQTEIHFCTILTLMSPPPNVFHHLKCVYWNVHWQGRFLPTDFANVAAAWNVTLTGGALGNMANVSHTIDGAPSDPRFAGVVTLPNAPHCNTLIRRAFASPNVRESNVWHNFDVTK
jgi:hypothetical protein